MPADRETIRFARAILARPHKFTILILVANFFVFLLMWQSNGMSSSALWEFSTPVLIAYGAKINYLINDQHQWWRLVVPMFLHAGLIHLLVNMYALWMLGPYVEKLYGSAKFVVFWVTTGVLGVVASYLTVVGPDRQVNSFLRFVLKTQDSPSVGASGALFGLVGVLFVFGIKFRHELPEGFKRAFGTGLLPMIILNLVIGYLGRGLIDNAAHLGGLLSGAALASVVDYQRPGQSSGVALVWRILQIAAIALVLVSGVKIVQHFRDTIALPTAAVAHDLSVQSSLEYFKAFNDAQEALVLIINDRDATHVDNAMRELEALPPLDPDADMLRENMKSLLIKASELHSRLPKPPAQIPNELIDEHNELVKQVARWTTEYNRWLKTMSALQPNGSEEAPK